MSDVVLIYPTGGNVSTMVSRRIPLGLLAISAILDKEGYKIKIIDQQVDKNWRENLYSELKTNPICVGLSCTTGKQILHSIEVSKFIKDNSSIPIVWGGVHPSTFPEQTLENKYIDYILCGEGDIIFPKFVKALKNKTSLHEVQGLYYKENGEIKKTEMPELIRDLDSLEELPLHLVNVKDYNSVNYNPGDSIDLITSKGCPYGCTFCYNLYFNKRKWRGFSIKRSLDLVEKVVNTYGIKNIHFVDDNLGGNQKHFIDFIKGIVDRKINISWGANGLRVNNISMMSDNELKLLVESGCKELGIGVESANERILKSGNKIKELLIIILLLNILL